MVFRFDLSRCVVFDVEVYPGRWCVGFNGQDRHGKLATHVVDGDPRRLGAVLDRLAGTDRILAGYNSERFDIPVIRGILGGLDP
jgi:hypothetical protein